MKRRSNETEVLGEIRKKVVLLLAPGEWREGDRHNNASAGHNKRSRWWRH